MKRASHLAKLLLVALAAAAASLPALGQESRGGFRGRKAGAGAGRTVAVVPDLDGDGIPELVLGSPGFDSNVGEASGRMYVIDGLTREPRFTLTGDLAGDQMGGAVGGGLDLDGDGVPDLAAGTGPSVQDCGGDCLPPTLPGALVLVSGADGSRLARLDGSSPHDNLGASVALVPDLDGDAVPEVVVGSTGVVVAGHTEAGRVSILSGADLHEISSFEGSATRMRMGFALAVLDDATGDGAPEIAVGAPGWLTRPGRVYFFSGSDPEPVRILEGDRLDDRFGRSLAAVGDMDGDGRLDLLVGAPQGQGEVEGAGAAFLYGSAPGSQPGPIRVYRGGGDGGGAGDHFGWSVADAGDVDGDGIRDHLVGAPGEDPGGREDAGRLLVYSGRDGSLLFAVEGAAAGDRLGWAAGGGLTAPEYADVLAGAPGSDPGGREGAGEVFVYRLDPALPCLGGNVNTGAGPSAVVLTVNGSAGSPLDRVVTVEQGAPLRVDMALPPSRTQARFALYAYVGLPDEGTVTEQPFDVGTTCFDTPLGGNFDLPVLIWNNLGEPLVFGFPNRPSTPAASVVLDLPGGWNRAGVGTLQGFIRDDASPGPDGLSVTNGVSIVIP